VCYERGLTLAGHDHTREWSCTIVALGCGVVGITGARGIGGGQSGLIGRVEGDGSFESSHFATRTLKAQLKAASLEEQAKEEEQREKRQYYHAHHRRHEVEHRHLRSLRTARVIGWDGAVAPTLPLPTVAHLEKLIPRIHQQKRRSLAQQFRAHPQRSRTIRKKGRKKATSGRFSRGLAAWARDEGKEKGSGECG